VVKVDGDGERASDDEESQTSVEPFVDDLVAGDINTFVADNIGCVDACLEQERILEAAGCHVAQSKGMRHCIQLATECAKQCCNNEVPHKDCDYMIICDYVQNMPLSNDGGEQPG
jgi:hypothetical protein